jgi:hypothetical protein
MCDRGFGNTGIKFVGGGKIMTGKGASAAKGQESLEGPQNARFARGSRLITPINGSS